MGLKKIISLALAGVLIYGCSKYEKTVDYFEKKAENERKNSYLELESLTKKFYVNGYHIKRNIDGKTVIFMHDPCVNIVYKKTEKKDKYSANLIYIPTKKGTIYLFDKYCNGSVDEVYVKINHYLEKSILDEKADFIMDGLTRQMNKEINERNAKIDKLNKEMEDFIKKKLEEMEKPKEKREDLFKSLKEKFKEK